MTLQLWTLLGSMARTCRTAFPTRSGPLFLIVALGILVTCPVWASGVAPTANNDTYAVNKNATLTVIAPGVLDNDTDPEGDEVFSALVSDVSHGTLSLDTNGSFVYTPNTDYFGPDIFTYKANDGTGDSNTATVTINVNDPPVAVPNTYNIQEDDVAHVFAAPGVLANDTDAFWVGSLTAVLVRTTTNGTLSLNPSGAFTYLVDPNYYGTDSFQYKANDGMADSNTVTVDINVAAVNDAPVAVGDSYSTTEDTLLTVAAPGVLGNDTDVDNVPADLSAVLVDDASNGTLVLVGDGGFTYQPDADFTGADAFTYKANDGNLDSNTVTVDITVTAVNDAPVAVGDAYTTDEDTLLTVTAPGVLGNDTDTENDTLTAALVTDVANGTLALASDGGFTYQPDADWNGVDTFTYKANDGSLDSNTATVTITVAAINDAPVATGDAYTTDEDTQLDVIAPGVLDNDTDVENDPLNANLVTDVSNGTLTLNADGSFSYNPDADWNGVDTFTYYTNDGDLDSATVTVTITVNAVNDAPVAVGDEYSVNEDALLTVTAPGVLGNDTDTENDTLTAALVTDVANGTLALAGDGGFTYQPDADWNGVDSFTYKANDGALDSNTATVTITVNAVNDAPVAVGEEYTTDEDTLLSVGGSGVLGNDTDVENDPLNALLVTDVSNGTLVLNTDGSFTYQPDADWNGVDTFTYKANDGNLDSNTVTVTITVAAVNDAPVAVGDSYVTDEDTLLTVPFTPEQSPVLGANIVGEGTQFPAGNVGLLDNDSDVDNDPLTAVLVTDVSHGTLALSGDGSFTYMPATDWNGVDNFTYKANDGALDSNVVTVTITVNAMNDAPVAVADAYSIDEDTQLLINPPGVLENDSDVDGDSLTAVLVDDVGHGTLVLDPNGSFTYQPDADWNGVDTFTYKAIDLDAQSNVVTVTITVNPVNDAPVAVGEEYTTDEDILLTVAAPGVLDNDSDVDNDPLTAVLVTDVTNGTLVLASDGGFTYLPDADWSGVDTFTYKANDGNLDSNTVTVTITVAALNDPPVAVGDEYEVDEDTELNVDNLDYHGVLFNDTDAEGDPLTAVLVSDVANGTLGLLPDGTFIYMPDANFNGVDTFTYVANDGNQDSNVATVTITVLDVNDPPTVEIIDPTDGTTVPWASTITVTAVAHDNDGTIVKVEFYLNGVKIGADATDPYTVTWNNSASGTYTLMAKAYDDDGAIVDSDTITVIVNTPPVVNVTAPVANRIFAAGSTINITAEATDPGGVVDHVEFYRQVGSGPLVFLGEDSTSPYTNTWNNLPVGTYNIVAIAEDTMGARTESAPVQITVVTPSYVADGQVKTSDAGDTYVGDNIYNVIVDQTKAKNVGVIATYVVKIQNDGNIYDSFKVTGTGNSGDWTVKYYNAATGGTEITSQVTGTGWTTETLDPQGFVEIRVEVIPGNGVPNLEMKDVDIVATSTTSPGVSDTVCAQTTRVALTGVNLIGSPANAQLLGRSVTLTASPVGGANVQYQFRVGYVDTSWHWTVIRTYSTNPVCTWTPTAARTYTVQVWAREVGSLAAYQVTKSISYTIKPLLSAVNLTASPASPSPKNTSILLTATKTGGLNVWYYFRVGYKVNDVWYWTVIRNYAPSPLVNWTPTVARTYTLVVVAREMGGNSVTKAISFTVTP